jgi:hypothetical protein
VDGSAVVENTLTAGLGILIRPVVVSLSVLDARGTHDPPVILPAIVEADHAIVTRLDIALDAEFATIGAAASREARLLSIVFCHRFTLMIDGGR